VQIRQAQEPKDAKAFEQKAEQRSISGSLGHLWGLWVPGSGLVQPWMGFSPWLSKWGVALWP